MKDKKKKKKGWVQIKEVQRNKATKFNVWFRIRRKKELLELGAVMEQSFGFEYKLY